VLKTHADEWHMWDGVVAVRYPVVASILVGDVLCQRRVTHARRTVVVLPHLVSKAQDFPKAIDTKLTNAAGWPAFRSSAAAKVAMAAPRLWPVTTSWYPGVDVSNFSMAARTPERASVHDSQKPR
jgi:hypothetical protein